MRELETLRDFFASATMSAIVDVPFIFVTLTFIGIIGGKLVFVPLVIVPIVIITAWLTQPAMDRLAARTMNEGLYKQTVLVEAIGARETVKRSEERRVGKECVSTGRARWWPHDEKKNKQQQNN